MWPLLLILIVAAALLYLAFLHSKLAKEVKEVKEAAQACMTIDDWEEEAQKIEALQRAQTSTSRHVSMLATSVRSLEQVRPNSCPKEDGDVETLPDFAEDTDLDATATDAAHTEDQIQAMLSSMANMFGVARQEASSFPQFAAGTQLFIASTKRAPTTQTVIEEADEEVEQLDDLEEDEEA